jgi:predicted CXXCH cytochrome family protein
MKKLSITFVLATTALLLGLAWAGPPASVQAAPLAQEPSPEGTPEAHMTQDCKECHLDIANHWASSPHAHAFDDAVFQERWASLGYQSDCLACHTTNFQHSTGEYEEEGVECKACHGEVGEEHPPAAVPIKADTDYCGSCHTTTLGEWRSTGHGSADIGCLDCHDPHSQGQLFEVADDMCINCHEETMGNYLEDLHIEKGIGCVDCHALVIPPEVMPEDGIVPTGHSFMITTATCIACHTDTLHAGFSLPGYEAGATAAINGGEETAPEETAPEDTASEAVVEPVSSTPEQQVQALEAALASRNLTVIFQGGVVGLVLGGTTAWFVANNLRSARRENPWEDENEPITQ